jgi:DEAD/DEAH box helicase
VLAPTRELAVQTHQVCEEAGKEFDPPIYSVCIFGGVSKDPQKKALREGAQVRRKRESEEETLFFLKTTQRLLLPLLVA